MNLQAQDVFLSAELGAPLYQAVLGEEAFPGWEVEVLAFAGSEDACQVEVALYRPEAPDAELASVPVTLEV